MAPRGIVGMAPRGIVGTAPRGIVVTAPRGIGGMVSLKTGTPEKTGSPKEEPSLIVVAAIETERLQPRLGGDDSD